MAFDESSTKECCAACKRNSAITAVVNPLFTFVKLPCTCWAWRDRARCGRERGYAENQLAEIAHHPRFAMAGSPRVSTAAILVIGNPVCRTANSQDFCRGVSELLTPPLVCQEVVGQSVIERTIVRLQNGGVRDISVITDGHPAAPISGLLRKYRNLKIVAGRADRWFAKLNKRQMQTETITVVAKVGAYVEFDVAEFLSFHRENHSAVSRAHNEAGPLDLWAVSIPADGQPALNLSWLMHSVQSKAYLVPGYVRQVDGHRAFRQLAIDMLSGRCAAKPEGREVRPGVWIATGARVHPRARVVAPAYVGADTTVGPYAVITRCSNLERGCDIGAGTYVAGSSILSCTRVGRSLFVSDSMVDGNALLHLRRNTLVKIADASLVGRTKAAPEVGRSILPQVQTPRVIQIKAQPRAVVAESCSMGLLEDEG